MSADFSVPEYPQMILMFEVHYAPHAHYLIIILERDEMIQKSLRRKIFYKILHATTRGEMPH